VKWLKRLSRFRVLAAEIASLLSFLMLLIWSLWQEYHRLFK